MSYAKRQVTDLFDSILFSPNSPVEDTSHLSSAPLLALAEQQEGRVLLQHTPPRLVTHADVSLVLTVSQDLISIMIRYTVSHLDSIIYWKNVECCVLAQPSVHDHDCVCVCDAARYRIYGARPIGTPWSSFANQLLGQVESHHQGLSQHEADAVHLTVGNTLCRSWSYNSAPDVSAAHRSVKYATICAGHRFKLVHQMLQCTLGVDSGSLQLASQAFCTSLSNTCWCVCVMRPQQDVMKLTVDAV